eukprot:CAMPEP_0182418330 /NCGR_PEP_ID=MMETSP1167-20130531/2795_1 /TAXON_ID=2988 /ORGANISM="Mallomonas Sp, Strain CCMP3275" /LENGTH=203 /DNA_ID=CAMNT_0024592493 /DNA_START=252 /DNA_END=863 /DNA_ORIENTATION=+
MDALVLEAKQRSMKNDKKGALFALKKKKMLESEILKLQGATITLTKQQHALESASINVNVLNALKVGGEAMQQAHGDLNADKVDDIMEDIAEQQDLQDQISDAIGKPATDLFDDEDLLRELQEMEEQSVEDQLLQSPSVPLSTPISTITTPASSISAATMPSVPTANIQTQPVSVSVLPPMPPTTAETEEERLLRELQSSMLA